MDPRYLQGLVSGQIPAENPGMGATSNPVFSDQSLAQSDIGTINAVLDKLINDVDGFQSVKLLNKKKAEFLFKDGSTKIVEF